MAEPAARTDVNELVAELRKEKTRTHRRSWRDARRKGIVENFHDVENCEWCALIDQLVAALVSVREERDEALRALRDEMQWDMGGVPENEWKRRAGRAEDALRRIVALADRKPIPGGYRQTACGHLNRAVTIAREALREAGAAE